VLERAGAEAVAVEAYRTLFVRPGAMDRFQSLLREGRIDAVAFCSPSSARSLASFLRGGTLSELAGRTLVASIGARTSAAVGALEAPVDLESDEPRAETLMAAIVDRLIPRIAAT
jgi:uroporphyrinogen-III synthase